jgi:hypothetical protein
MYKLFNFKFDLKESLYKFSSLFCIVILPIIFFVLHYAIKDAPDWQGVENAHFQVFLSYKVTPYFYPFFLYSVLSGLLLIFRYNYYRKYFIIRWGIYTGTFLAFLYLFLGTFYLGLLLLGASAVAIITWFLLLFLNRTLLHYLIFIFFVLAIFVSIISHGPFFSVFGLIFVLHLLGTPALAAFFGVLLILYLHRDKRPVLSEPLKEKFLISGIYSTLYGGTTYLAILKTIELYQQLPKIPPDCYIATAAAKGHASFVGSTTFPLENHERFALNRQLQTLKCFELILKASSPRLHCFIRKIYNVYGKKAATKITSPWLADITYLSLKPLELFAYGVVKIIFPRNYREIVSGFYHP